jgi:hypothetical protein
MACQNDPKDWLREYIYAASIGEDKDTSFFLSVDPKTEQQGARRPHRQWAWAVVKRGAYRPGWRRRASGVTPFVDWHHRLSREPRGQAGACATDGRAFGSEID